MGLYLSEKASATEVLKFITDELGKADTYVHAFSIWKGAELMAKLVFNPYSTQDKRQVYSVSKTITSTAVGIMCYEYGFDIDEKVINIFPDKCPENVSENLGKLTVRHLLTMTDGHDSCSMSRIANSDDGVRAYFEHEFKFEPGTEYVYNTGASYMLSAIVSRVTKMTMLEYLNKRLFEPLDIKDVSWPVAGGNINEGGAGLRISFDDLEKVAQMYASNGRYGGKQILHPVWLRQATSYQSSGQAERDPDWKKGYGFQIWLNDRGGFRADGAFGQYFIVIPEKDITMVFFCESHNVEAQLPLCFDLADRIFEVDPSREESEEKLRKILKTTYLPLGGADADDFNAEYILDDNINGYETVVLSAVGSELKLKLTKNGKSDTLTFANGAFAENNIKAKGLLPQLYSLVPHFREEDCRFLASFEPAKGGAMGELRFLNCAHTVGADIKFDNSEFYLKLSYLDDLKPSKAFELKGKKNN